MLIATWCATATESCVDWLRRVLYVGGDADTVGAVAGWRRVHQGRWWPGQIACPLLTLEEVLAVYQRAVAVAMPVNCAAARRYAYRQLAGPVI